MPEIAIDPAAVRSTSRRLATAGESRVAVDGAGGAANCGAPIVASVVAEFERELRSYTSLVGAAIAGIGHCAGSVVADMESAENTIQSIIARLQAELGSTSAAPAASAAAPAETPASPRFQRGNLESIMGSIQ